MQEAPTDNRPGIKVYTRGGTGQLEKPFEKPVTLSAEEGYHQTRLG